jgi:hypothetical protein
LPGIIGKGAKDLDAEIAAVVSSFAFDRTIHQKIFRRSLDINFHCSVWSATKFDRGDLRRIAPR